MTCVEINPCRMFMITYCTFQSRKKHFSDAYEGESGSVLEIQVKSVNLRQFTKFV